MYGVYDYCRMAADEARVHAYTDALKKTVGSDSVVIDLGAGIGLFSIVAAKLGAKQVFAVDINDAIEVGKELARAAGVADRVTFVNASAWDWSPPVLADVLFHDLRGTSPLFQDNFRLAHHARSHWLRPGGTAFPTRDRLVTALVRANALRARLDGATRAVERLGVPTPVLERVLRSALHSDRYEPIDADDVLTESFTWGELSYGASPPRSVRGQGSLAVTKDGSAQGLAVWFETDVLDGISYDTRPGTARTYARSFLPFQSDVRLAAGDRVDVSVSALTDGSEWSWTHAVLRANGAREPGPRQSTFESGASSLDALLATAPSATPKLTPDGERARHILAAIDGATSLDELAQRFTRGTDDDARHRALEAVRALARKYAR